MSEGDKSEIQIEADFIKKRRAENEEASKLANEGALKTSKGRSAFILTRILNPKMLQLVLENNEEEQPTGD